MKLELDELLFLRDVARMEISRELDNLERWEKFDPVECGPSTITEEDILLSIQYHESQIRTANACVQKLTQMLKEA